MNRIILILALGLFLSSNAYAGESEAQQSANNTDIDCIQYSADQIQQATSNNKNNSYRAVYSNITNRQSSTNKDCGKAELEEDKEPTTPPIDNTHSGGAGE